MTKVHACLDEDCYHNHNKICTCRIVVIGSDGICMAKNTSDNFKYEQDFLKEKLKRRKRKAKRKARQ